MGAGMDTDSIQDAQDNIAKLQNALDDAQKMLQAAERAQEAAQRAHEAAERHAKMLRTASFVAIGVITVAALMGFRRRNS
jgi:predicted  nucleic acid-binding Zn-ribbon protein